MTAQLFTQGLQGMPNPQADAVPNRVKRHSSINQKQEVLYVYSSPGFTG